jgi:hypothetical protein
MIVPENPPRFVVAASCALVGHSSRRRTARKNSYGRVPPGRNPAVKAGISAV